MSSGQAMVVVDAGYLIKALVINARRRSREQLELDWVALTEMIATHTHAQTGLPLLRQTWYDASWFAQPRDEHRILAAQPGVHVRLGWLVRTDRGLSQKAVDTQMVRDLVVAAIEQTVTQVVIIAGDGDLVPAVNELVDRGIKVHIWDVASDDPRVRQSHELLALADQRMSLELADIARFVRVIERPESGASEEADPYRVIGEHPVVGTFSAAEGSMPTLDARLGPPPLRQLDPYGLQRLLPWVDGVSAADFGTMYGAHWADHAGPELVLQFFEVARRPGLPRLIDHDLLRSAREHELALDDEDVRHQLRDGFWQALDQARESLARPEPDEPVASDG